MDNYLAFDIETTGPDPRVDSVTTAAVYGDGYAAVVEARDESELLAVVGEVFAACPRATVVGWNSAVVDFPFLHTRMLAHGITPFFTMALDTRIVPKYAPLPGYAGGYAVQVLTDHGPVEHVDIAYRYRTWAEQNDVHWALKDVARAAGLEMVEVDRQHMEQLSVVERMAYNLSDVVGTYELALLAERILPSG